MRTSTGFATDPRARVLIVGTCVRAAAESAALAGFRVASIDAFADVDQHPGVRALSLDRDMGLARDAFSAARASRSMTCDAVVYGASFENHPEAIDLLGRERRLWGNDSAVVRRVRRPGELADALRRRGLACPSLRASGAAASSRWLVKPLASGGGHGVHAWRPGMRVSRSCYVQEFIDGTVASVAFVAAGGRAVTIGVTRQLIGERVCGAAGFQYCGSILPGTLEWEPSLISRAVDLAGAVAEAFELVGLGTIDFIERSGVPYAIEVNPRWSSSMDLIESRIGLPVFQLHADACARSVLPAVDVRAGRGPSQALGKAIVFARRDVVVGDTTRWRDVLGVRDIPHPFGHIRRGQPVCTVYAEGRTSEDCRHALARRARQVYAAMVRWPSPRQFSMDATAAAAAGC